MLAESSYQQVVNGAEIAGRFRFHAWDAAIFPLIPAQAGIQPGSPPSAFAPCASADSNPP